MMTPDKLIATFRKARGKLLALQGFLAFMRAPRIQREHAREAYQRLEQMLLALRRFGALQAQFRAYKARVRTLSSVPAGAELAKLRARRGRIEIAVGFYGEAFYYFGHRTSKCLQQVDGFNTFRPPGICGVRNQLIEHPRAIHRSYTYENAQGFTLKSFRHEDDASTPLDAGLYPNAQEFVEQLLSRVAQSEATPGRLAHKRAIRRVAKLKRERRRPTQSIVSKYEAKE